VTSRLGDFTGQAGAYARSRPGYPRDLVERLLALAGVESGNAVAELGAGTGLFTECIAGRGLVVSALEPNEAMRAEAPELPGVTWLPGTFETTGLPGASQRWAVAAQAFHWADEARALPEQRRILVPGGRFTVLWNDRLNERSPVLIRTEEAIRRWAPGYDEAYRRRDWGEVLVSTGDFEDVATDVAEHVVPMSRERYLGLWRSHNRLSVTAGPNRYAAFLRELEEYLVGATIERVDVPYACRAWTARAPR
jgi:SAM-dependent methyltransferase